MSGRSRIAALLFAGGVLLAGALPPAAIAQEAGKQRLNAPVPHKAPSSPTLWNYFVVIVIVGAIGVANLIPSKRGHQD